MRDFQGSIPLQMALIPCLAPSSRPFGCTGLTSSGAQEASVFGAVRLAQDNQGVVKGSIPRLDDVSTVETFRVGKPMDAKAVRRRSLRVAELAQLLALLGG